eukprot:scaffold255547_cov15-Tisochrysis_lutea.AAC.1
MRLIRHILSDLLANPKGSPSTTRPHPLFLAPLACECSCKEGNDTCRDAPHEVDNWCGAPVGMFLKPSLYN